MGKRKLKTIANQPAGRGLEPMSKRSIMDYLSNSVQVLDAKINTVQEQIACHEGRLTDHPDMSQAPNGTICNSIDPLSTEHSHLVVPMPNVSVEILSSSTPGSSLSATPVLFPSQLTLLADEPKLKPPTNSTSPFGASGPSVEPPAQMVRPAHPPCDFAPGPSKALDIDIDALSGKLMAALSREIITSIRGLFDGLAQRLSTLELMLTNFCKDQRANSRDCALSGHALGAVNTDINLHTPGLAPSVPSDGPICSKLAPQGSSFAPAPSHVLPPPLHIPLNKDPLCPIGRSHPET